MTARRSRVSKRSASGTARRKKTAVPRRTPRRAQAARRAGSITRLEQELPRSLQQFSRRVRARLTRLETRIQRAEARARRRWTRLLREASHQLGRFEAEGERRWRQLTSQARRDALRVLRRLERELEGPRRKAGTRKKARRRAAAESAGSGI